MNTDPSSVAAVPQLVIVCSSLAVCLLVVVLVVVLITWSPAPAPAPGHAPTEADYLQLAAKSAPRPAPDLVPAPPLHYHEDRAVWTVPICTSSLKSEAATSEQDTFTPHHHHHHHHDDHYARIQPRYPHSHGADLDESSPGTHV